MWQAVLRGLMFHSRTLHLRFLVLNILIVHFGAMLIVLSFHSLPCDCACRACVQLGNIQVKVHVIYVDLADRRSIATCWRELALHMHTSAPPNSISRKLMLLEKRMTELRRATHTPVMAWDQFKAECLCKCGWFWS